MKNFEPILKNHFCKKFWKKFWLKILNQFWKLRSYRQLLYYSLRYQGPNAWNSLKNHLLTLHFLGLHPRMPFWRQTLRYLTGFVKRCLQKWWKQANSAAVTKYKKATLPTPVPWSQSCQSATHCTLWVHSDWWSKANYHSGLA